MSTNLPHKVIESDSLPSLELQISEADRRILIVDDEEMVRHMFSEFLSETYECTTAASCDEALEHLAVDTYAVVISDMTMPGRNGVELLRQIVMRYPDTLVIMVSGVDRPQRIRDAMHLGAFDYLIKPCELEVLGFAIERALQRRTLTQTAKKYKADLERQNTELAEQKAKLELLQAQLVQSEKMASLGELAAGVAHELNNPAGFIYGNMDLLKHSANGLQRLLKTYQELVLPDDVNSRIKKIKSDIHYETLMEELNSIIADCAEGASRISDVVRNLRLFSRMDEADATSTDLHEGLDSTVRLLSRYYGASRIKLIKDYGEIPQVKCFASQLNQVWMNLLVNAAQAVAQDGEVKITTRVNDDLVTVQVTDNGCGIPPAQLSRVFDPFFTTKVVGEGTGLGLSISYGIVERQGGTLFVESQLGKGTTFSVRLPIEPKPKEEAIPLSDQHTGDEPQ